MKGRAGLALVEALIVAMAPHLPPEVRAVRVRLGVGRWTQVWAVPADVPGDVDYGFYEVSVDESGGSISSRGPLSPFGVGGTWVPFVPRSIRRRWDAIDAAELVVEAVHRLVPGWPAPAAVAKARTEGDDVFVWFEDKFGRRVVPTSRIAWEGRFDG
jgi:hypothetical protein